MPSLPRSHSREVVKTTVGGIIFTSGKIETKTKESRPQEKANL